MKKIHTKLTAVIAFSLALLPVCHADPAVEKNQNTQLAQANINQKKDLTVAANSQTADKPKSARTTKAS